MGISYMCVIHSHCNCRKFGKIFVGKFLLDQGNLTHALKFIEILRHIFLISINQLNLKIKNVVNIYANKIYNYTYLII